MIPVRMWMPSVPTVLFKTSGILSSSMLGNVLFAVLFLPVHAERITARTRTIPKMLDLLGLIIAFRNWNCFR